MAIGAGTRRIRPPLISTRPSEVSSFPRNVKKDLRVRDVFGHEARALSRVHRVEGEREKRVSNSFRDFNFDDKVGTERSIFLIDPRAVVRFTAPEFLGPDYFSPSFRLKKKCKKVCILEKEEIQA